MADIIPGGPVHYSRLKKMRISPAHYLSHKDPQTPSTGKGSALHSVLLGGKRVVEYGKARNKKHKAYQAFLEEHPSDLIVSPKEAGDVLGMRRSIEAHPVARRLLDGVRETLIEWTFAGRKCAGTPDVVHPEGVPMIRVGQFYFPGCRGVVDVELKTSKTAAPWAFPWECKRYGYYTQNSWYKEGIESSLVYPPGELGGSFIVVVENVDPWPVTVCQVEPKRLAAERLEWREWMDRLLQCERTGEFPAYTDQVVSIGVDDDLDLDTTGLDDEEAA